MSKVWTLDLDHGQQAVMLVLADHAHDDGTKSFPGTDYIAWKTNYSRRQVQRYLDTLAETGIIEVAAYATGGRGHATEYTLHLEKGVTKSPFSARQRVTNTTVKGDIAALKGDTRDVKGDTAMSPQPSVTTIKKEPSREPSKGRAEIPDANRLLELQADPRYQRIDVGDCFRRMSFECGYRKKEPTVKRLVESWLPMDLKLLAELPEWLPVTSWSEFMIHRRQKKEPLTALAESKQIKQLAKWRDEGYDPVALIDYAITKGWTGIYIPKEWLNGTQQSNRSNDAAQAGNGQHGGRPSRVSIIRNRDYSRFAEPSPGGSADTTGTEGVEAGPDAGQVADKSGVEAA